MILHFPYGGQDSNHADEGECSACWSGFPCPCKCGGMIHAEFGDENYDGDFWLERICTNCDNPTEREST